MKRNFLIQHLYSATSAKYLKFKVRLDKARQSGRFYKFSRRKQHSLIVRLKRLFERLKSLGVQLRLAGAGAAFALTLSLSNRAAAQTLGPFVINDVANPLPPPYIIAHPKPAVVDIDNDGDLDVFVGNFNGDIEFYRNTGGATTVRRLAKVTGSSNPFDGVNEGQYAAPAFADVDGDGDFDMLLGTYYGSTFFFRNTGSATNPIFAEQTGAANPFNGVTGTVNKYGIAPSIPVFVDIDKDGDVDLFMGSTSSTDYDGFHPAVKSYRNNAGIFTLSYHPLNDYLQFFNRAAFTFADLDNDSDLDVLVGNLSGQLRCFTDDAPSASGEFVEQTGPWNPVTRTGNPMNGIPFDNGSPVFADFDDDGDLDLIVGQSASYAQSIRYFENTDGAYTFKERSDLNLSPFGGLDVGEEAAPVFVDIDNDGDLDAVLGAKYNGGTYATTPEILVYIRNASGDFVADLSHPLRNTTRLQDVTPVFADIDNDGDKDFFYGHDYTVDFFRNNSGSFVKEVPSLFPTLGFSNIKEPSLAFVDVDNDGDLDAIFGNDRYGQPKILYFQNTGTASTPIFTSATPPAPFGDPIFQFNPNVSAVDLDNDGDTDIALSETYYFQAGLFGNRTRVRFFENKGDGTFPEAAQPVIAAASPKYSFTSFEDLDGDGDLDGFLGNGSNSSSSVTGQVNGQVTYFENTNPPPVTTILAATLSVSGGIATLIVPTLTLTDSDNDQITKAVISITGFRVGEEVLAFTPQAGITGTFDTGTGVLTLSGLASVSDYVSALRSVTYQFVGSKPASSGRKKSSSTGKTVTLARTIGFLVSDADLTSPLAAQKQLQVTFPNVVPTLSSTSPVITFTGTPVTIDAGVATADGDDANLEGATVQISAATLQSGEDQLVFTNQNGITGSYVAATGVLSLTGVSSLANYQSALRSVRYNNTAPIPNTAPRTITMLVTDGESPSGTTLTTLNISVSLAPVLTGSNPNTTFTPATGPIVIDGGITASDADNSTLQGATIRITNFIAQDQLLFTSQNGISGTYDGSTGILSLTGTSSIANYQTALRSIQFNIGSTAYNLTDRSIQFIVTDGSANSIAITATVKVANQVPSLSGAGSPSTFTPSSGPQIIASCLIVTDADNANLQSARVFINNFVSQDQLIFANQNGITGSYNTSTGELLLSGDATVASYQTALRSIQFNNPSPAFTLTNRTIEFSVNDGTSLSAILVAAVNIANQLPAVTLSLSSLLYASGDLLIDNGLTVLDTDNSNLQSAEVKISTGLQPAEDALVFNNQNGITGSYNSATGTLTLSGSATKSDYQTALRSAVYRNTNSSPTKTARTITFRINDGTSFSTISSLVLNFNSAPVINLSSLSGEVGEKITVDLTPLISDPDSNLSVGTIKILAQPTSGAIATLSASLLLTIDYQAFNFAGNDQLSLEACDVAGTCTQKVINISVNNAPPVINVAPVETVVGGLVSVSLIALISDPNNNLDLSSLSISQQPISGAKASIDVSKTLVVDYSGINFAGTDNLKIRVCDLVGACIEQTITIQVEGDIEVFNGISPNNDDLNAYLQLKNIAALEPNNKVSIYSRWGDKVFEIANYNNADRRFEGQGDGGKELPSGTYFYKIEFTSGRKDMTGYLTIKH